MTYTIADIIEQSNSHIHEFNLKPDISNGGWIYRRVVCAANRLGPNVILGARHFDFRMHEQIAIHHDYERMIEGRDEDSLSDWRQSEQGFIDQYGHYMDRQEAWKVAYAAGQIIRRVGGDSSKGGTLYSENLY